jgi:hypothetical protein
MPKSVSEENEKIFQSRENPKIYSHTKILKKSLAYFIGVSLKAIKSIELWPFCIDHLLSVTINNTIPLRVF